MKLDGHLLYIDITQICGIGCAFCMYADKHAKGKHMVLSEHARSNLRVLINDPSVKRISVSGEGEPLNNISTFYEILSLSRGGNSFEFITSGFFPHDKMEAIYDCIDSIASKNGDVCNIRLSTDSHHIEKVKWRAHAFSLEYFQRKKPVSLSFSFRSVDSEREFTRNFLLQETFNWGLEASILSGSSLEDLLVVGKKKFAIDYKNLVHPSPEMSEGYLDMYGYIAAIEAKVKKPFTFGSLNQFPNPNGMDVTIKPNGDVFFYGIESEYQGNINSDIFDWSILSSNLRKNPLVYNLYTRPLIDLLARLADTPQLQTIIAKTNNPYWLIKELAKHSILLEQMKAA